MTQYLCPIEWPIAEKAFWAIVAILLVVGLIFISISIFRRTPDSRMVLRYNDMAATGNLFPYIIFFVGLVMFVAGLATSVVYFSYPLQRFLLNHVALLGNVPKSWSLNATNEALSSIEDRLGTDTGLSISSSEDARNVRITGDFEGSCGAELIKNICDKNSTLLDCRVDTDKMRVSVCRHSPSGACTNSGG